MFDRAYKMFGGCKTGTSENFILSHSRMEVILPKTADHQSFEIIAKGTLDGSELMFILLRVVSPRNFGIEELKGVPQVLRKKSRRSPRFAQKTKLLRKLSPPFCLSTPFFLRGQSQASGDGLSRV